MSKPPKNIEKIVLGVGAVAGLGLAALGFMKASAFDEDFSAPSKQPGPSDTSVSGAELVPGTINSLASDRVYTSATVPNEKLESGQRPVDLFVGVPLYANRDNPNEPIDPLVGGDRHPPIPNAWWLKYGVDMTYADSPQRDDDGDGYSNLEEFQGKTDPSDSADHPPLIAKLFFTREESAEWLVLFGTEISGQWMPKLEAEFSKDMEGNPMKNKVSFGEGLKPGDVFFAEEPMAKRFKFIGFEDRVQRNQRLNIDENLRFAIFEDLSENKPGKRYEIPNRLPRAQRPDWVQHDRTAYLELQAIGQSGQTLKVVEGTRFALPKDAEAKDYFLKEVTPEHIVVEWKNGYATEDITIPKGGLPYFVFTR
ncbi:MAG: Amuc_1099 family pilus-like system protein [Verrucomicrobiales bacterium]